MYNDSYCISSLTSLPILFAEIRSVIDTLDRSGPSLEVRRIHPRISSSFSSYKNTLKYKLNDDSYHA